MSEHFRYVLLHLFISGRFCLIFHSRIFSFITIQSVPDQVTQTSLYEKLSDVRKS